MFDTSFGCSDKVVISCLYFVLNYSISLRALCNKSYALNIIQKNFCNLPVTPICYPVSKWKPTPFPPSNPSSSASCWMRPRWLKTPSRVIAARSAISRAMKRWPSRPGKMWLNFYSAMCRLRSRATSSVFCLNGFLA